MHESAIGNTKRQKARKADTIPRQRLFLIGGGKPAQPSASKGFCDAIVNACLDGEIINHYEFALGFAAAVDAISRGTFDMSSDPIGVVEQAWSDVANVTKASNKITDIMRGASE